MNMEKYYIAYGSNLNFKQMTTRCPTAMIAGTATLEDWTLLFKGSKTGSYLTIEPQTGCQVPVAVWKITEIDERQLDIYEGFPSFYYKKQMTIKLASGRKIKAFAYIMRENRPLGIPSNEYVNTCLEGYRFFGFEKSIIDKALKETERRMAQ